MEVSDTMCNIILICSLILPNSSSYTGHAEEMCHCRFQYRCGAVASCAAPSDGELIPSLSCNSNQYATNITPISTLQCPTYGLWMVVQIYIPSSKCNIQTLVYKICKCNDIIVQVNAYVCMLSLKWQQWGSALCIMHYALVCVRLLLCVFPFLLSL